MNYRRMTNEDLDTIIRKYIKYYNDREDGCWTYEQAYKRIHQVLTIEDSCCLIQCDERQEITGFAMGYYKEFDDIKSYYLEEIVIFDGNQNQGYGTDFMMELEHVIREHGANSIKLISVNDAHHQHFYTKLGFHAAPNLFIMGKYF